MKPITRRNFLSSSTTAGLRTGNAGDHDPRRGFVPHSEAKRNSSVGGGGNGRYQGRWRRRRQRAPAHTPAARSSRHKIVALCDVDQTYLDREVKAFKDRGDKVATYTDLRKVFDDKSIDAVVIALPNHWHALATIWACPGGQGCLRRKAVFLQHLGRPANGGRGPQTRPHGPGGHTKSFEHAPARGVRLPARRPYRGNALCPCDRVPCP